MRLVLLRQADVEDQPPTIREKTGKTVWDADNVYNRYDLRVKTFAAKTSLT
jgi:hypothetical protein